jgi:uncharacterized YccA/Bax inhibitor family protein
MSRNPILTDRAFEEARTEFSGSPADEWSRAQGMGAAGTTTAPPPLPGAPGAPGAPNAPGGMDAGAGAGMSDAALSRSARRAEHFTPTLTGPTMSMGGVASATLVMFAVLLVGGWYGWTTVSVIPEGVVDGVQTFSATFDQPVVLFGSLIGALVLALVTSFKPKLARITGVLYALLEGVVLGAISAYYGALFQGIVAQAVLATLGVFLVMLVLYGLRILRATPKFVKGVIGATFGILFMYLGVFLLNLFGVAEGFWTSGSPIGIGISVVVVIVAALNLILDFDFIEKGSQMGLPRYMDWYAGFGLLVTLVWLYLEMLRLLARLRQ